MMINFDWKECSSFLESSIFTSENLRPERCLDPSQKIDEHPPHPLSVHSKEDRDIWHYCLNLTNKQNLSPWLFVKVVILQGRKREECNTVDSGDRAFACFSHKQMSSPTWLCYLSTVVEEQQLTFAVPQEELHWSRWCLFPCAVKSPLLVWRDSSSFLVLLSLWEIFMFKCDRLVPPPLHTHICEHRRTFFFLLKKTSLLISLSVSISFLSPVLSQYQ